jgi:hypothetical protein
MSVEETLDLVVPPLLSSLPTLIGSPDQAASIARGSESVEPEAGPNP